MSIRELSSLVPTAKLYHLLYDQIRELSFRAVFWLTAFTLVASMVLGGGTRPGFLSDVLLQLFSIPLLIVSTSQLFDLLSTDARQRRQVRWAAIFCYAVVLLPIVQLVPLPPSLWTLLPNRAPIIATFNNLNSALPWLPISVVPNDTWLTLPALIPPFAVLFGTVLLNYRERRMLSIVLIGVGIISAFLGLMQISQGPASMLRFFTVTNETDAVGFFANRNHFAALLNTVILFAAAWAIENVFNSGIWRNLKTLEARSIVPVTTSVLAVIVLLAAQAMTGSRAGMILMIGSVVGIYALAFSDRRRSPKTKRSNLWLIALATAILLVVQFGLYRATQRLSIDALEESRLQYMRTTLEAALAYMPFGSGLGTFVPVYAMFEKVRDLFAYRYLNHAHNDVAEFILEAGIFALALLGAFITWFISRAVKMWSRNGIGVRELDRLLTRAATIAIALLLTHSFVDYPLRTAAMMAIFVVACGFLIEPLTADERRPDQLRQVLQHASSDRVAERPANIAATEPPREATTEVLARALSATNKPAARWGEGIDWPEAWCKPSAAASAPTDNSISADDKEPVTK